MRLDFDASTTDGAVEYLKTRALQLLKYNISLIEIVLYKEAVVGFFKWNDRIYQSIYILKQYRGQGLYSSFVRKKVPIITSRECNMMNYLGKKTYEVVSFQLENFKEYKMIQELYGDRRSKRSQIHYMNHIDEGLAIMSWLNMSYDAQKAYCLHPMFQSDLDLFTNHNKFDIDSKVMMYTIEYRSVANEYLSHRKINNISEIRLSPIKEVNDMLIADKIQNYKDFLLYHKDTHPRSKELDQYFRYWLGRLRISKDMFLEISDKIIINPIIYDNRPVK
jgi:hypothetical protein